MTEGTSLTGLRERLVAEVLQTSGIGDERIAAALRDVPRHLFLPHLPPADAYLDDAIVTTRCQKPLILTKRHAEHGMGVA